MKFGRMELKPTSGQKSFYNKAVVEFFGDWINLYSYNSRVCRYNSTTKEFVKDKAWNYSATTKRHQKAFIETFGITA